LKQVAEVLPQADETQCLANSPVEEPADEQPEAAATEEHESIS
jgi:hypothetical protein